MACTRSTNILFSPVLCVLSLFSVYTHNYIDGYSSTWVSIFLHFSLSRGKIPQENIICYTIHGWTHVQSCDWRPREMIHSDDDDDEGDNNHNTDVYDDDCFDDADKN